MDGCLLDFETQQISAIIETKRSNRASIKTGIGRGCGYPQNANPTPSSPFFILSQEGLDHFFLVQLSTIINHSISHLSSEEDVNLIPKVDGYLLDFETQQSKATIETKRDQESTQASGSKQESAEIVAS